MLLYHLKNTNANIFRRKEVIILNFEVICTPKEADKLKGECYIDIYPLIKDCYCNALQNELQKGSDRYAAELKALSSVFVMGYVSGVRAEREKKTNE